MLMNQINKAQYDEVLGLIHKESKIVLDIGFGNAKLMHSIAKQGYQVTGIEIEESLLNLAKKKYPKEMEQGNMKVDLGYVEKLPYQDQTFDTIYSVNTLYFWELEQGLSEIQRCLKPNGQLVLSFYEKEWLDRLSYTNYGFTKYSYEEIEKFLIQSGFIIQSVKKQKRRMAVSISCVKRS